MVGFVSLVGAGPGDPELLTMKAARCLGEADLVLYDALVNPEVLHFATNARRFCVGKRGHQPSFDQRTIEHLMVLSVPPATDGNSSCVAPSGPWLVGIATILSPLSS